MLGNEISTILFRCSFILSKILDFDEIHIVHDREFEDAELKVYINQYQGDNYSQPLENYHNCNSCIKPLPKSLIYEILSCTAAYFITHNSSERIKNFVLKIKDIKVIRI